MKLDARTAPIHAALEAHLAPKHLAYALRLWSEKFIEQPNLSLKMFVESFYTRQTMSMRSHELYNHLLPAMMEAFKARLEFKGELIEPYDFPDYDLEVKQAVSSAPKDVDQPLVKENVLASPISDAPAEPEESEPVVEAAATNDALVEKTPKQVAPIQKARIERYEIFSLFMRVISNKIPVERREKLFKQYAKEIQDCCVFPVGKIFFEWLTSDTDYFEEEGLEVEEMSNVTHTLYMGMCEYLGPVMADSILNDAIRTTNNKFPYAEFDINKLL